MSPLVEMDLFRDKRQGDRRSCCGCRASALGWRGCNKGSGHSGPPLPYLSIENFIAGTLCLYGASAVNGNMRGLLVYWFVEPTW